MDAEHRSVELDAYLYDIRDRLSKTTYFENELALSRVGILRFPGNISDLDQYISFSASSKKTRFNY